MVLKIDRKLLPIKAHYFFFNGGTAPLMPFIPVYARQLGVPQMGVGLMYTVLPFVSLVAKPTFGAISDKFRLGKVIFMMSIALTAMFYASICFIPAKPTEAEVNFDCGSPISLLKTCGAGDDCIMEKINSESENRVMHCLLDCRSTETGSLEDLCSAWNISQYCANLTSLQFSTTTNMSKALAEQSCLYLPVDKVVVAGYINVPSPLCSTSHHFNCSAVCDSTTVMSYISKPVSSQPEEPYYATIQFQLLFILMIGSWASQSVAVSLSDSICFSLLGDRPHDYGVQRLWGALGWGLFAIISGYLIDLASIGKQYKDYTPSLYLIITLLLINLAFVSRIKITYSQHSNVARRVCSLFANIKVLLFLFGCVSFGICIGIVWQFLFWFLEDLAASHGCDSLQWIKLLEGLAMGIQCFAGEAPFLFLSGWFLNKMGHVHTMTMILGVMGVRLLAYSFLTNPWYVLPIELLNGLTLGVYWSTMASYAHCIAPAGASSTMQGIFSAIFEGIGTSIGSLLGGAIFQTYGGVVAFRSFGIYALLASAVFSLSHILISWTHKNKLKSGREVDQFSSEESYSRVNTRPPMDQ